ncbi:uncharacterized protein B0H18DRAFT_879565, partial [Fomitopsis serialis]|uniref:uncharacterized protein n=1 Tax=Fomitopsis serialis TaxID=139415 RepID=UPI0020075FCF
AITILAPSDSEYWVQNQTNTITWDYTPGDPNPIDIVVSNTQNTTLNGNFSIAQYVNLTTQVSPTNVTLVTGGNYQVSFVDPANASVVYATSGTFSVDAPGTSAAPSVSPSSVSSSASGSAASSTSPSSSGSSASTSNSASAAPAQLGMSAGGVMGVIAACGVASLSALLL